MEMYGAVVLCTQNLAVSGANQILVNLLRGGTLRGSCFVISPSAGPLDKAFSECGAVIRIGIAEQILHGFRDIRIVICNTLMTASTVIWLSARKIPHLWILHEWWTNDRMDHELSQRKMDQITSSSILQALDVCHKVVCVSVGQQKLYGLPPDRSQVVHVGVPTWSLSSSASNLFEKDLVRFLCMGIICPRKNQLWLVQTFKRFAVGRPHVRLELVGARAVREYEIEYLERVKSEAKGCDQITIHAVTPDPPSYYAKADVLVLCSTNEVTPLVIPEAMACGLPVIATSIAGIPYMMENGVDGYLIEPENEESLLSAMGKIADSLELRLAMGKSARTHAIEKFSLNRMLSCYARAIRSVAPITVLVDMDGVVVDWDRGFRDIWNDRSPIKRSLSYIMQECVPISFKEEATRISRQPGFFRHLPHYPGAIEAVKSLSETPGFRVLICTAPMLANPTCVEDKMAWVSNNFGHEWLERVVFARDKTCVRGDVLIDDKPDVSRGSQNPSWRHLVFKHPYNEDLCMVEFPHRMGNWNPEWKSVLLNLLNESGHRISADELSVPALSPVQKDHEVIRHEYAMWRQGSLLQAHDEEDDEFLRSEILRESDEFESIHLFREGYRNWRIGSPRGAANPCHFQL